MKLRPLPEIDLARIAPLPTKEKWTQLRSFKSGGGFWSYKPARDQVFNVFHPSNPMGLKVAKPSLLDIENSIRQASKCDAQEQSCLEVTRLLSSWAEKNAGQAVERPCGSMAIGQIAQVRYWNNFVFLHDEKPTFAFLDHRRGNPLTKLGARFALSMMHEQIRVLDPDFSDAKLLILQFPQIKQDPRYVRESWDHEFELFGIHDLQSMVEETYEIWRQVNEDRAEQRPRAAGDDWWG